MNHGNRIGIKELKNGRIVTQNRDLYRVDGYLMAPDSIPPDTSVPFELEMQCFELKRWYDLPESLPCVECIDYDEGWLMCVPGTEEYDNRDVQDNNTSVSICTDPNVIVGRNEYENAFIRVEDLSDIPPPC